VACFTFPLAIPLHFLLTWLVLRLKFVEAITAWIYILAANALYIAGMMGIILLIKFLLS
jgi:hypothetical protein